MVLSCSNALSVLFGHSAHDVTSRSGAMRPGKQRAVHDPSCRAKRIRMQPGGAASASPLSQRALVHSAGAALRPTTNKNAELPIIGSSAILGTCVASRSDAAEEARTRGLRPRLSPGLPLSAGSFRPTPQWEPAHHVSRDSCYPRSPRFVPVTSNDHSGGHQPKPPAG